MSPASTDYWENRYRFGGTSGKGSRGKFATMKGRLVNFAAAQYKVESLLDLGCGDGTVANLIEGDYLGLDPSPSAVRLARGVAPQHTFEVYRHPIEVRECHMSLDVIRHIMDDHAYHHHIADLFSASRIVMVWSSDVDHYWSPHERERHWTLDIPKHWRRVMFEEIGVTNSAFSVYRYR